MNQTSLPIGIIGLGNRGYGLLYEILDSMPDIDVLAVCDSYIDRANHGAARVFACRGHQPFITTDAHTLLANAKKMGLACVMICTAWESHIPLCIEAMEYGIPCGCEVGGAYSVEQCWDMVRTYERTKTPVMLLENCCYGKEEMTILNMIKHGVFGEIVHCEGGYRHDLRDEITEGQIHRHYRRRNYLNRNGELYPTHELGPIAKYLNLNRGNRMLTLTSTSCGAHGLYTFNHAAHDENFPTREDQFMQGDVVTTVIKCAHGQTIVLTHDTSLPRPYSRGNLCQGTFGIWSEDKHAVMLTDHGKESDHEWTPLEKMYEKWLHPLWRHYDAVGGHDGMDYLVLSAFFDAVRNDTPMPIDVYDMASWMVVTALSEQSVAMGSMPVPIPDFTNGMWLCRAPYHRSRYCLEDVCEECFPTT